MAVTVAEANRHIRHALGGGDLSPELSHLDVLNESGEFLSGMHPWKYLERPAAALSFVADQTYVELPSDLREIIGYNPTDGLLNGMQFTTHQSLIEKRTTGTTFPLVHHVAVTHYINASGVPVPRLEIWPTPTTSEVDALSIFYRAGWTRLVDDSPVIPIPDHLRSLYYAIVRAFAQGYEQDNVASIDMRLEDIASGQRFRAAREWDAHLMPDYGFLTGGAAEGVSVWRNLDGDVAGRE